MQRRFRQMLAGLLAVMTVATALPLDSIYAAEQPDQVVLNDAEQPDQVVLNDAEQPDQMAPNDTEQPADAVGGEDTEQPAEENIPESVTEDGALINFVAVDAGRVEVGGTQNIVVDIGDSSQVITAAALGYHRVSDNSAYEIAATMIVENGLRFSMNYTSQSQAGEYVLDYLNYTMNGKSYTVLFDTTGMDIRYGVGIDVERTPDAEVVDEPESAVDMEVVTFGENGQQTSEQSIADAIASQQNSGVRRAKYNGNLIVVLDPGHDASHAGAFQNGLKEQDLTLKIAQYCKEELERYSGVTVYMTRTTAACAFGGDNSNCLKARAQYAQSVGADVFVSLHLNSNTSSSPHGVEIYRPNANYRPDIHDQARDLANDILEQLAALGLNNRGTYVRSCQDVDDPEYVYPDGTHADYYAVIRNCKRAGIPAMIVEHAFLSNTSDVANFLNSEEKLKRLGVADATGIANYYGLSMVGNYDAVFDAVYYADHNPDIKAAYGYDERELLSHFTSFGMAEGRRANAAFDVKSYYNMYGDLRAIYGKDWKQYYLHYIQFGVKEGRVAIGVTELQNPVTVYNGVNYGAVYNYDYYLNNNPDVKRAYDGDENGALQHFVLFGMKEGRRASASFDVKSYYYAYPDLRMCYGKDWKSYYLHYVNSGVAEKRTATGVTTLKNPVTVYNGVNYKAVYDFNYYISRYSDMKNLYRDDDVAALRHFVNFGMAEARQGIASFDVVSYVNAYRDLRGAYGSDLKAYYLHYVNYGVNEKRIATGVTTLQNPLTIYQNVDYAVVYDYNYYLGKYPDLKAAFLGNETGALKHFVEYGMREGRQASASFDVDVYRSNYLDLQQAFGNNLTSYYLHYINSGVREGRDAVTRIYHSIMGGSTTTVMQMANYFNAKATYPSFYGTSDAKTINDLCQIFYEESVQEGVDPAVAFCQTIVETGWLTFGGQVSINQYNFAGLGALDTGEAGATFPDARTGVRAQVQHLKAYASSASLNNTLVDPRFHLVKRGSAPYVEWLGQQENPSGYGWATGKDYGSKILNLMSQLYTY